MTRLSDERGLPLTGLDAAQIERYDALLTELYSYIPGVQNRLEALVQEAPGFVLGQVLRGYSIMADGLRSGLPQARQYLAQAEQLAAGATERERLHISVLRAWTEGRLAQRLQALEDIVLRWPLDLLAYRQLTGMLFWTGDKRRQLAAALQALPHWDPQIPGYRLVLGPLAFALEEAGHYTLAESHARKALDYRATDLWALHALAHVLEMQGRVREGEQMLAAVGKRLNDFNLFRGHLWWHLALFKLALGRDGEVLRLWDEQIFPEPSAFYLDQQNAASMLARLEIQGLAVGRRWEKVAQAAEQTQGQHLVLFTVPHQAMALAHAGRLPALAQTLSAIEAEAKAGVEQAPLAAAVSAAMALYCEGAHRPFLQRMRALRHEAQALGASHAQQDLFFQLMVDAALRLDDIALAKSLLKERLAGRLSSADHWPQLAGQFMRIDQESDPKALRSLLRSGLEK